MIDTVIVGGGPAGVSAALYLKRLKRKVVILTNNTSVLNKAHKIDNYYGVSNISGEDLYKAGLAQAKEMGVDIINTSVLEINKENSFSVVTNDNTYNANSVIIATGASRLKSGINNLDSYEGQGVSYCATCDGFFFRDKKVGVIGSKEYALLEANHLLEVTSDVTIYTNGEALNGEFKGNVITDKITKVEKDGKFILEGENGNYEADGVFVAVGVAGSMNFAKKLGLETSGNYLVVNNKYETFIPGLYAIGDTIGGFLQISKAVYDGSYVSVHVNKFLKEVKDDKN